VVDGDRPPIDLSAVDVMAIFDAAAAGAATDDKRIYLAGVILFSEPTEGHRLCAVGADGVALSYAATAATCPNLGQFIIHRDTCKLTASVFGKTGASLRLGARLIDVSTDSTRIVAKLIDATPSAWRSFVPPPDVANSVTVPTKDLMATFVRVFAVINNLTGDVAKRAPSITLWWDASAQPEVRVSFGLIAPAVRDVVPVTELNGKADISVNPQLLLRLLESSTAQSVRLSASSERGTPLRIDAGSDRFALLSPIRDFDHAFDDAAA
jgi:DNA polymerase III sliding clamp (beta) subunit (PCNA family)